MDDDVLGRRRAYLVLVASQFSTYCNYNKTPNTQKPSGPEGSEPRFWYASDTKKSRVGRVVV